MKIGDEVVINIAPKEWVGEYYRALSGQSGIVSKYLGKSLWEVTFKAPIKMPHKFYLVHGSYMAESLNFNETDLVPYVKQVRLEPCPFCGNEAKIFEPDLDRNIVSCVLDHAPMRSIEGWNTRTS